MDQDVDPNKHVSVIQINSQIYLDATLHHSIELILSFRGIFLSKIDGTDYSRVFKLQTKSKIQDSRRSYAHCYFIWHGLHN